MASYQYYGTNGQQYYDTSGYSTSSYKPAPTTTETYIEETYDSYGNKVIVERKNYGHGGYSHEHGALGYGYGHQHAVVGRHGHSSDGHKLYGSHSQGRHHDGEHGVLNAVLGKNHSSESFSHGATYSGHHHKGNSGGHGSGRTHVRLFRKKREDGHSDSDSYSDSDHE